MNLLLINPHISYAPLFPIGLAYLSSVLKRQGVNVHCLDLCFSPKEKHHDLIRQKIVAENIDTVGIGGLSRNFCSIRDALNAARKARPGIRTIIGGALFSTEPDLVYNKLEADFGVFGEAEETVSELIEVLDRRGDIATVRGIAYRDRNADMIRTADRAPIEDIDALPFPDYDGFNLGNYLKLIDIRGDWILDNPRVFPLLASRSCPFKCTFCYHTINKYRQRSLDSVFAEIDYAVEHYQINGLDIFDDLFAIDRDRLVEFCRRIKGYNLLWMPQLRVNNVDSELLGIMKDAGCWSISYGLESMSRDVLKSMRKKISPDQIKHALRLTYENQIDIQGNFIFGDTAETLTTANETINWWASNQKYRINLTPIETYPGTELYLDAVKKRIIQNPLNFLENACPQVNNTQLSQEDYAALKKRISLMQEFLKIPCVIKWVKPADKAVPTDRYAVCIRCPHCGDQIVYNNIPLGYGLICCRNCRGRFNLPIKRYLGRTKFPKSHTDQLLQASAYFNRGEYGLAADLAIRVLRYQRQDFDALFIAGSAALHRGEYRAGELYLQNTLCCDPDSPRFHNNYGVALFLLGKTGAAHLHFRHALFLKPDFAEAIHNKAVTDDLFKDNQGNIPYLNFDPEAPIRVDANLGGMKLASPNIKPGGKTVAGMQPLRSGLQVKNPSSKNRNAASRLLKYENYRLRTVTLSAETRDQAFFELHSAFQLARKEGSVLCLEDQQPNHYPDALAIKCDQVLSLDKNQRPPGNRCQGIGRSTNFTSGRRRHLLRDALDIRFRKECMPEIIRLAGQFGIVHGMKIVTLSVPERVSEDTAHATGGLQNGELDTFCKALDHLVDNGYYVVRIGERVMTPLDRAGVIDLAAAPVVTSLLELFCLIHSHFFITSQSEMIHTAELSGTPTLIVNANDPLGSYPIKKKWLLMLKHVIRRDTGAALSIPDMLEEAYQTNGFKEPGPYVYLGNTPDEILAGVIEMLEVVDDRARETKQQKAFRQLVCHKGSELSEKYEDVRNRGPEEGFIGDGRLANCQVGRLGLSEPGHPVF